MSNTFVPWCHFVRSLGPDANLAATAQIESPDPDSVHLLVPNPIGGYVEVRTQDAVGAFDLRWVDEALKPVGAWHTALVYPHNIQWSVNVDQQGRALVLAFTYPPSFGPPAPPSEWKFIARWMGEGGPLTDQFKPAAPIFTPTSPGDFPLFAGWGSILALPEGGFALFQYQVPASFNGSVSLTGWYAYYRSGRATQESAPGWLHSYDGSLQLLAGGRGYSTVERDPNTCARTVSIVAPSGRACFTLELPGSALCTGLPDSLWPDGTLVLWDGNAHTDCLFHWWPGLARPAQ